MHEQRSGALRIAAGYIFPVFDYEHTGGRARSRAATSIADRRAPSPTGLYVYGDFCSGEIFGWTGGPSQPVLLDTTLIISSFGEDESGELYVVGLGGTVHRLVPNSAVQDYPSLLSGLPDFDGPRADILWRHSTPGIYALWLMDGATVADSAVFGFDTDWSIAALGDVDGDGTDDILWRSTSTGALGIWFITDAARHALDGDAVGPGSEPRGGGDLNGDGRADILWRSVTGGTLGVWFMNGAEAVRGWRSSASVPSGVLPGLAT